MTNENELIAKLEQKNRELEAAHEELTKSEKRFRALIEHNFEAIVLLDANGFVTYQSPSTERIMGFTNEEIIGRNAADFFHPEELPIVMWRMETALKNPGKPIFTSNRILHKNGHYIWTEGTTTNFLNDDNVQAFVGNFRDITFRKLSEDKILQANRMYAFISAINQAIVHVSGEAQLLREVCRVAVEIGKFELACVAQPDVTTRKLRFVAHRNFPESETGRLANPAYTTGGPTELLLTTGKPHVINNFRLLPPESDYAKFAMQRGFHSAISIPFLKSGKIHYTLNLFSTQTNLFDKDELTLLNGIADDVSFALDNFEKERKRKEAEMKLLLSEQRLNQAQQIAHFGSWYMDMASGRAIWSDEHCRIYGLPATENLHSLSSWLSFIHPDDLVLVTAKTKELDNSLGSVSFVHRIVCKNGETKHLNTYCQYEIDDDGKPVSLYGVTQDITRQRDAELKITHLNRLYLFISQLNQAIVHISDEHRLFTEACRIAVAYGEFKTAWIGVFNRQKTLINVKAFNGMAPETVSLFNDAQVRELHSLTHVLNTGSNFICNDAVSEYTEGRWQEFTQQNGIGSVMVLPIFKSGDIHGIMSLYASEKNIFDTDQAALLNDMAGDLSFAIDVFEKEQLRKQMEEKVRQSETNLNEAQALAHFGSWQLDLASGLATWSDEACRIFGLPPDDNVHPYEIWLSFIHPDDMKVVPEITSQVENAPQSSIRHRIVLRDGSVRHVRSMIRNVYDTDGKLVILQGVTHDETDIKMAEQALQQSEANLRMIIDLIPQLIFAKNAKGKFLFVNKPFAESYGKTAEQLINKSIMDVIPERSEAVIFMKEDDEVLATGITKILPEDYFTDHQGNKRVFYTVKVPYTEAGTNERAVLGISMDVTEQKKAEYERARMINEIMERNKDLEQFSYIVSHNLRAPVANIIGLAETMDLPEISQDEKQELLGSLAVSVRKLDDVIMDLNYILQVKEGIREQEENVSFTTLITDIKMSIGNLVTGNIDISYDFSEIDEIYTLRSYIYSIFYNLITNSIKYRKTDIPTLIEVCSKKNNQLVELYFKDNGIGIDLKRRGDQVFGLYKRFHTAVEGKGMGLFMVKTQVQALGGSISVASEVNHGTEFKIQFKIQ